MRRFTILGLMAIVVVVAVCLAALREAKIIDQGMIPKVESAVAALRAGVEKVQFIDGRLPHSLLLEIFTDEGVGTEVVP